MLYRRPTRAIVFVSEPAKRHCLSSIHRRRSFRPPWRRPLFTPCARKYRRPGEGGCIHVRTDAAPQPSSLSYPCVHGLAARTLIFPLGIIPAARDVCSSSFAALFLETRRFVLVLILHFRNLFGSLSSSLGCGSLCASVWASLINAGLRMYILVGYACGPTPKNCPRENVG